MGGAWFIFLVKFHVNTFWLNYYSKIWVKVRLHSVEITVQYFFYIFFLSIWKLNASKVKNFLILFRDVYLMEITKIFACEWSDMQSFLETVYLNLILNIYFNDTHFLIFIEHTCPEYLSDCIVMQWKVWIFKGLKIKILHLDNIYLLICTHSLFSEQQVDFSYTFYSLLLVHQGSF